MALIYRSLFSVDGTEFLADAPRVANDWLRWKLDRPDVAITANGEARHEEREIVARWWVGARDERAVFRVQVYEERRDEGEQVRTTFTAFADGEQSWALTDIERWVTTTAAQAWVPLAPSIVTALLETHQCRRGPTPLGRQARAMTAETTEELVATIVDPAREIPVVVVSPNRREGATAARNRAGELARSLAGIAPVYLLKPGAVSAFSRAMLEVDERLDVYGGAIRTYQPAAGGRDDHAYRHRVLPFHRFDNRPPHVVVRFVAAPILARATETPPPPVWRERIRELLEATSGDSAELLELYEAETERQKQELEELSVTHVELEERHGELEADSDELLGELDRLRGHVRYLQGKLAEFDQAAANAVLGDDPFVPEWCAEVVDEARKRLQHVVIPDVVRAGAEALDEHVDASWARRAWSSLQALDDYAKAKQSKFRGDFFMYCEQGVDGAAKIPTRWVGRHESRSTKTTERFRELRMLPVATEVSADGRMFMEEHIKIEQGGTPAPRIHFYDDTGGATKKVHIGWFGDHLDSRSKS